jgi:hypothetical protein
MESTNAASDLAHIRTLMDRSMRFISLSGLSGVFAGVVALAGAWVAQQYIHLFTAPNADPIAYSPIRGDQDYGSMLMILVAIACAVLGVALLGATWFTWRRSKRLGQGLWDQAARRLMWNLLIPLAVGGLVCLALMYHGLPGLVAPATLVFYGLALLNASKYTLDEIRWLAVSELVLGVVACFWIGAGLMFWALGFGVLHIAYGGLMWVRHERDAEGPTA